MKYNTTTINAKPGEILHIVLKSTGTIPKIAMAHNFVLLVLGADVDEFIKSAMNARVPPITCRRTRRPRCSRRPSSRDPERRLK